MTEQELGKNYKEICKNLSSRRLKPAFDLLETLISENGLGVYLDQYRNLEETYHFMLRYTVEGIRDPERQKIYRKLIVSVFELADHVFNAVRIRFSASVEYEKKRMFRDNFISSLGQHLKLLEEFYRKDETQYDETGSVIISREHQQDVVRLFYHIWFSDRLVPEEADLLRTFLVSSPVTTAYKSFLATALTLSLQRYFDREKFDLLFDACDFPEPEINQRAMVGLLINLYKYDDRLPFYPAITGRLKILSEHPQFKHNVERIIVQFIRSRETEKLQQRIRDEILPEMIKISPNLKNKIDLDSLMEEGLSEDKNPDWQEIFKDSPGLMDKMKEFSELQLEGADVFLGSFAMLKYFPFYQEMSNWFIPFFPENPEIVHALDLSDETNRHLMEAIDKAPVLCNSDKYSFCFSIQSLPKENREFIVQGMKAEMEQLKELEEDEELTSPGHKAAFVSNQYIQDLYRFYKLFPRKGDFEDVFSWRFDFHNKIALGKTLREDISILKNIAEYYFARNYFDEAAEIFGNLPEKDQTAEIIQKIAYCHQKAERFKDALNGYLKADLYDINRLWNLRKIALCYRNLKKPAKALEYYQAAEKMDPESLNNQLNIGHCLLELERYEEALKCYFKVEYLAPGNKKVWRPIAWCSFLTGKRDQAEKYFQMLMDNEPGKHDYMNMGHVQWSLGNRKAALEYYRKSVGKRGFTLDEFMEVFNEDSPHLVDQGIEGDDVPIMLDQLRYLLEE